MTQVLERTSTYALGHSPEELRRLDTQGIILRPYTERLLRSAGIGPGMRVLDAGCGTGDVSLLAAELIGPTGSVLGLDRSPEALATARSNARAGGFPQVRFEEGDVAAIDGAGSFDAVIGRLILAYQPDPAAALRNLTRLLRPGGIVAFGEFALLSPAMNWPERPLLQQVTSWIVETLRRTGAHVEMGIRLHSTFTEAGLPDPNIRFDGIPITGAERALLAWPVNVVRSMLPAMERLGVVSATEVDIDTLLDRVLEEASAVGGATCAVFWGGAWATKP